MKLVFEVYDFDNDGRITTEDVRLVLSYIPFRHEPRSTLSVDDSETEDHTPSGMRRMNSRKEPANTQEGLYQRSEGKDMGEEERGSNTKQINRFVQLVFEQKKMMNLREFIDFNTNVSSEMFISVISIFQERLPCSQYIYRQKKVFKTQEFLKNQKSLMSGMHPLTQSLSKQEKDEDALVAKAEELCMSPLRAIANPKMLHSMSLKK
jgi:hypothetical protein